MTIHSFTTNLIKIPQRLWTATHKRHFREKDLQICVKLGRTKFAITNTFLGFMEKFQRAWQKLKLSNQKSGFINFLVKGSSEEEKDKQNK